PGMSEAGYAIGRTTAAPATWSRGTARRTATGAVLAAIVVANAAVIVWLWVHGGNASDDLSTGELLTSLGRLTGLLGSYAALLQVLLLARLPWIERLAGFDRLRVWHRWNGHACLDLVLAHVFLSVWGYAAMDKV